ncbi:MAG: hypothetical protein WAK52_10735 [Trichococcus sp.]
MAFCYYHNSSTKHKNPPKKHACNKHCPCGRTLYCYAGFGVFAIPFENAPLHPYEAMHLGDINEDIISHLAMAGNTVIAKIEIVVT